jgi:protein-S-isoprenylcysteine O-methyltransferase Ste14
MIISEGLCGILLSAQRSGGPNLFRWKLVPMNPKIDETSTALKGVSVPRWMALILAFLAWLVAIPFAHGVVPWAISSTMHRYGWTEDRPGIWNLLGVIPVALGAALLIWVFVVGISQTPKRVKLRLTPAVLMSRGPYTFTRNPMYVAELGIWMGWALFFGSIGVFAAALLLWAVVSFVILPREELTLEAAFGQVYLQYKDRTRRWL